MTKYARPVAVGSQTRLYDVIDTSGYDPRPSWGQTDSELLDKMFAPNKAAWLAAGQWFVQVLSGVRDCCIHTGTNYADPASYLNSDGSNGNGEMPQL